MSTHPYLGFLLSSDHGEHNCAAILLVGALEDSVVGDVGDHDITTILVLIVVVVCEDEGAVQVELQVSGLVLHYSVVGIIRTLLGCELFMAGVRA